MSNWTKSFEDGIALLAILHYHDAALVPNIHELVPNTNVDENLTRAWDIAETKFDVPKLLELIDMKPPEMRSMQTYIIELHKRLSKVQRKSDSPIAESIDEQVERLITNTAKPTVTSVTRKAATTPTTPATVPAKEPTVAPVEPKTVETSPSDKTNIGNNVPETVPTAKEEPQATTPVKEPVVEQTEPKPQPPQEKPTTAVPVETAKPTTTAVADTIGTESTKPQQLAARREFSNMMFFLTLFFALFAIFIYKAVF